MKCERAQEILWPLSAPREYVEGEREAREHLESCPRCRRFFERDARLAEALERLPGEERAPRELRERIDLALSREPSVRSGEAAVETKPRERRDPSEWYRGWPVSRGKVAAVAAGLLIGVAVWTLWPSFSESGPGPATLFARDYQYHVMEPDGASDGERVRHATGDESVAAVDPAAVVEFLRSQVGVTGEPMRLPGGGVTGAMVCWLGEEAAAVVMYEVGDHAVYHYRLKRDPAPGDGLASGEVRTKKFGEVRLVMWTEGGVLHALVSDLPSEELRRLARNGATAATLPAGCSEPFS